MGHNWIARAANAIFGRLLTNLEEHTPLIVGLQPRSFAHKYSRTLQHVLSLSRLACSLVSIACPKGLDGGLLRGLGDLNRSVTLHIALNCDRVVSIIISAKKSVTMKIERNN